MSLLLDENLSPKLIPRLASLFPGTTHVRDVGLKQASDEAIWNWARSNGFTVVTTDSDFVVLSRKWGSPPQVIHLENCRARLRVIEDVIRRNAIVIAEFENSDTNVLALRF